LVSVALGAVTVLCTYKAALALSAAQGSALLAALLVALNPQFLFSAALVTNDALLAALSALLLWLIVELGARQQHGGRLQRPAAGTRAICGSTATCSASRRSRPSSRRSRSRSGIRRPGAMRWRSSTIRSGRALAG